MVDLCAIQFIPGNLQLQFLTSAHYFPWVEALYSFSSPLTCFLKATLADTSMPSCLRLCYTTGEKLKGRLCGTLA